VGTVAESGCKTFIVHARKALLQGLSPKENRDVPPLDYDRVARLKAQFPDLEIILNGGLDIAQAELEAPRFDGVMLGRAVWQQPMLLAEVDRRFYGDSSAPVLSALAVAEQMEPYIAQQLAAGVKLHTVLKPLFNLFQSQRGARQFRRLLSEQAHQPGADMAVWQAALDCVRPSFASA
jgi:tRNA-dihydrouridine synthase A